MPKDVLAQYPFPAAIAAGTEEVWVSGTAIVAIGKLIQEAWPLPNPGSYPYINETTKGVEFDFVVAPSSSSSFESDPSTSESAPSSKMAVVPIENSNTGETEWLAWHCVERPDVIFEDVLQIEIDSDGSGLMEIPWEFIASVHPESIAVTSVLPIGGRGKVYLNFDGAAQVKAERTRNLQMPIRVVEPFWRQIIFGNRGRVVRSVIVRIEAIRHGFRGVRYARKSQAEAHHNNAFWDRAIAPKNGQRNGQTRRIIL